jgi:cell division protein ZapA
MDDRKARVEVEIFGEYYTLKGDAAPEYMVMLAKYVSSKMQQLVSRNDRLNRSQAAVLAALNIADELNKLREEYDNLVRLLEPDKGKQNS